MSGGHAAIDVGELRETTVAKLWVKRGSRGDVRPADASALRRVGAVAEVMR